MNRGSRGSSPNSRRSRAMLRAREFSVTAVSPQTHGQQFFFRDQLVRIPEQHQQNPKCLWLHLLQPSRLHDRKLSFAHSHIRESENKRLSCESYAPSQLLQKQFRTLSRRLRGAWLRVASSQGSGTHAWLLAFVPQRFARRGLPVRRTLLDGECRKCTAEHPGPLRDLSRPQVFSAP